MGMSVSGLVSSGPLLLAIPVAAAAGAVTFLSPCCLPLVPGYLAYLTGMSGASATAGRRPAPADQPAPAAASFSPAAALAGGPVAVAGGAQSGSATVGALAGTAGGPGAAALVPPESGRGLLGTLLLVLGF